MIFSPKVVQHLGPATDFYKKLALDCSGQQTAVDLFLLSSQYSDLASLGKEYLILCIRSFHTVLFRSTSYSGVLKSLCTGVNAAHTAKGLTLKLIELKNWTDGIRQFILGFHIFKKRLSC